MFAGFLTIVILLTLVIVAMAIADGSTAVGAASMFVLMLVAQPLFNWIAAW